MTLADKEDIDVLAPASASVDYRNEMVTLEPVKIGQVPALVRIIRPMLASAQALASGPSDHGADATEAGIMGIEITFDLLFGLIDEHADGMFAAVALLTGRDSEWIREGDPAEFIELALAAVEVNRNFFTQRIVPLLGGQAKALLGAGQTPSSS